jgi:hypothetical protein
MSGFSDDGQWWWDGQAWIATSQVVLPQLPTTEFERSGKLNDARGRMQKRTAFLVGDVVAGNSNSAASLLNLPLAIGFLVFQQRAFRDYREWTLQQLALATTYLLGPDEPILAGETTMFGTFWLATVIRDLAVVVTASHVLVLRIDMLDGQPRWVSLAAHPHEVSMDVRSGPFGYNPMIVVRRGSWQWLIRGYSRVFQPRPVIDAWRRALTSTAARPV